MNLLLVLMDKYMYPDRQYTCTVYWVPGSWMVAETVRDGTADGDLRKTSLSCRPRFTDGLTGNQKQRYSFQSLIFISHDGDTGASSLPGDEYTRPQRLV